MEYSEIRAIGPVSFLIRLSLIKAKDNNVYIPYKKPRSPARFRGIFRIGRTYFLPENAKKAGDRKRISGGVQRTIFRKYPGKKEKNTDKQGCFGRNREEILPGGKTRFSADEMPETVYLHPVFQNPPVSERLSNQAYENSFLEVTYSAFNGNRIRGCL